MPNRRLVTGVFATPDGTIVANRSLTWLRNPRVTVGQGGRVIVDEPFVVQTNGAGEMSRDMEPGNYLVMVRLSDVDRYFEVPIPEGEGPVDVALQVGQASIPITPDLVLQAEHFANLSRRYANEDEDVPVVDGEFSSRHWSLKAAYDRGLIEPLRDAAVAAAGEAEGFRNEAESFRNDAAASEAQAGAFRDQTAILADAAGWKSGTSLPALPDAEYPTGAYFLLRVGPGTQLWEANTAADDWEFVQWVGEVKFDTVQDFAAYTGPPLPDGTVVDTRVEKASYKVDSSLDNSQLVGATVKAKVLPGIPGGINVRAFGAKADNQTDDRAAFLAAFRAAGRIGSKVKVPKGQYYFDGPLVLNDANLGFHWRNLYIEFETTSSPFQDAGGGAGWAATRIRVNGTSAFEINLEAFGHERINFKNFCAVNTTGTPRTGLRAIDIVTDGSRNYNYPVGWFFENPSCQNFEAMFRFRGINMPAQNNRYIGLIEIDGLHVWQTDYSIDVDGMYLNFFRGRNWRCHSSGKIRLNAQSGGHFFLYGVHHESARPSRFEIHASALNSFFSLMDFDGETNGDNTVITSAPYPDSFVTVLGGGQLLNQHEFIFTGFVRLPSFGELPPTVPAGIALSNYTQTPLRIIPKGCTIRTPDTVRIVAPPASGNSSARHFRFFVPLDRIKGRAGERFVAWPTTGRRGTGSAQPRFRRAKQFPGVEAVTAITNNNTFAGQQTGPIFSCAHVMDVVRNSTRPWNNPLPITIDGSATNHFLSPELANGPHLCVYGLSLGEDTLNVFAPPAPRNPGESWIVSPGLLSFGEDNLMASDYFYPSNYAQTFEQECPATDQIDIRVSGTDVTDIDDGISGTIKVVLDDGLSGAGEWRFVIRSDGRQITEVYNSTVADVTMSAPDVSIFDLVNIRVENDTAGPVSARALLRFD